MHVKSPANWARSMCRWWSDSPDSYWALDYAPTKRCYKNSPCNIFFLEESFAALTSAPPPPRVHLFAPCVYHKNTYWGSHSPENVQNRAVKFVKGFSTPFISQLATCSSSFPKPIKKTSNNLTRMHRVAHSLLDFPWDTIFAAPNPLWVSWLCY